jgi:hypothetical protein
MIHCRNTLAHLPQGAIGVNNHRMSIENETSTDGPPSDRFIPWMTGWERGNISMAFASFPVRYLSPDVEELKRLPFSGPEPDTEIGEIRSGCHGRRLMRCPLEGAIVSPSRAAGVLRGREPRAEYVANEQKNRARNRAA